MRVVVERASSCGAAYEISDDGAKSVVRTTCETVVVDGQPIAVFYDSDMNVLREPSTFMLRKLGYDPDNTREQAVSALKLLCSYAAIVRVPVAAFCFDEAAGFVRFARGAMGEGATYSFRGLSPRSESTVNAYLRVVRQYVDYLGVKASPFLEKEVKKRAGAGGWGVGSEGYRISARVPQDLVAPPYVSIPEYRALKAVVGRGRSFLDPARIIIRLEFEHGLRVGEVLGLTIEDLQSELDRAGVRYSYFLVLRDRVGDRKDQRAKSVLVKPRCADEYRSKGYRTRDVGYQKVYISEDLYFEIAEYVEATRVRFSEGQLAAAAADAVGGEWTRQGNQYVFLNTKGRPLSSNLWNKRLRGYFAQAGIRVDEGRRKRNLNHRLRHGFAMMLERDLGVDAITLQRLMRHRSPGSVQPYLLPSEEDVCVMYTAVISDMKRLLLGEEGCHGEP